MSSIYDSLGMNREFEIIHVDWAHIGRLPLNTKTKLTGLLPRLTPFFV